MDSKFPWRSNRWAIALVAVTLGWSASLRGQQAEPPAAAPNELVPPKAQGLTRLSREHEIWIDTKRKRVIVGGTICLRKGLLEMFACPEGTKEHESIVALKTQAYLVHAGLLAVGAKPGCPVSYEPEYAPATGAVIRVDVVWQDADQTWHQRRAQEMVRHVKTQQPMPHDWVFAGSGFWVDPATGKRYYLAEGGELVCLSNFSTATLDLPIESSQANSELLFEALTENIPPLDTHVYMILTPQPDAPRKPPQDK